MNYGQKIEEKVYKKYITHGINENVWVSNVAKVSGEKDGAVWQAFDVTFSNGESDLTARFFEYKYKEGATNWKKEILDKKAQEDSYLKRIKHLFAKVAGSPTEYDNQVVSRIVGETPSEQFNSMVSLLSELAAKNATRKFRLLCIDNGKGYATVPRWDSGWVEFMDVNPTKLKYEEAKYGKKKVEEAKVEVVASTNNSDLPF